MNNQEKINYIKHWLQKFGERDNETFYIEVVLPDMTWEIALQYNFDEEGQQIEPYNWCRMGFKHTHNNTLEERYDFELDEIILKLKERKEYY